MEQPDLGKKNLELRLAKGLTQEELAQKSNVNLRTIQRIESARVNPRSYTIKLIFDNLNYDFYDSSKELDVQDNQSADKILSWTDKAKKQLVELFNLKTNTMKKISILSLPILLLGCMLMYGFQGSAQNVEKVRKSIEQSNQQIEKWFADGKMDSIGMFYMENAISISARAEEINGRQNIVDEYAEMKFKDMELLSIKTERVNLLSEDIALETGSLKIKYGQVTYKGKYQSQWKYCEKKWRIENEISTMKAFSVDQ